MDDARHGGTESGSVVVVNMLRLVVVALVATLVAVVGTYVVWSSLAEDTVADAGRGHPASQPASEVVGEWDARRATAWADGDVRALAALYTTGSGAGDTDVEMLQRYVDRGLAVEGLTTQLLEVDQVSRGPDTLVVRVTDRVQAGTVVGEDVRHPLPRDLPTTRVVEFRLVERGWIVARVDVDQDRAPARPEARTSSTSESAKS